jgi:hypothetical protein
VQEYNDMYDVRIGVGVFLILWAFFALRTTLHQVLFDKVEVSPSWSLGKGGELWAIRGRLRRALSSCIPFSSHVRA